MALSQTELPIAALVYDPEGNEVARQPLGSLPRDHATAMYDNVARRLAACGVRPCRTGGTQ